MRPFRLATAAPVRTSWVGAGIVSTERCARNGYAVEWRGADSESRVEAGEPRLPTSATHVGASGSSAGAVRGAAPVGQGCDIRPGRGGGVDGILNGVAGRCSPIYRRAWWGGGFGDTASRRNRRRNPIGSRVSASRARLVSFEINKPRSRGVIMAVTPVGV